MISALTLRAVWAWLRKHALAIVAALAALAGIVAYALGRRSTREDTRTATDAARAEGRADVLTESAAEHVVRADAARAEDARLRDLQERAEAEAAAKAREVESMSPDEKVALGIALVEARRRRQAERGR